MILSVDDDDDANYSLYRICKSIGVGSIDARDYNYAINLLSQYDIKLIISDMVFGSEVDGGINFLKRLAHEGYDIPVAIFSSSVIPEISKQAINEGAIAYLVKPVSAEQIRNLYSQVLSGPGCTGNT